MNADICIRIDIQNPLLHHIRLVFADGLSRSNNLTVQIGQTDLVIIDQIKCSDTASHKCLAYITAHTADAKYSDTGIL